MTVFLANSFSPSMLKLSKNVPVYVKFTEIDSEEFCKMIRNGENLVNSIGHRSTVELINILCNTTLEMNRISITMSVGDILLAIFLTVRLEEGRILESDEIMKLLEQGKIRFVRVEVGS